MSSSEMQSKLVSLAGIMTPDEGRYRKERILLPHTIAWRTVNSFKLYTHDTVKEYHQIANSRVHVAVRSWPEDMPLLLYCSAGIRPPSLDRTYFAQVRRCPRSVPGL